MSEKELMTSMLDAMSKDEKLMPEIPIPEIIRILFNSNPTQNELTKKLIYLKHEYNVDYVILLPYGKLPPTIRFWKTKEIKELQEVTNGEEVD